MKKKMTFALAALFLFVIAMSNSAFAKEEANDVNEVRIQTTAWHFEQQNSIIDKLLQEEGVADAWFDADEKIVNVSYNPNVISVDNIRFVIEDMGYETDIVENDTEKESKYTSKDM